MEFELIERKEFENEQVWFEVSGSSFFLDEKKETLFVFEPNGEKWDIELKGETEESGETYKVIELSDISVLWEVLRAIEKQTIKD